MEDFLTRKIYVDSRFKVNSNLGNNANFQINLPEVVNLPEECIGYIDEIIMPVQFFNVSKDVNDKLYIGIFHDTITHYYTITLDEMNYSLVDLATALSEKLNLLEPNIRFVVGSDPDTFKIIVQIVDNRSSKPDVATFNIFDDAELELGLYNNAPILAPQTINNILQNYKSVVNVWINFKIEFYPDLHPIRNLYLCCSELSSYSTVTNFNWGGKNIIKKIPINVPFGSMLYLTQSLAHDYFQCGNLSLTHLNFQLKDSNGNIVELPSHWSFSIIFMRGK